MTIMLDTAPWVVLDEPRSIPLWSLPSAFPESSPAVPVNPFPLPFPRAFDLYLSAIYDADTLVAGTAANLDLFGVRSVLDCAAGTGLPAIGLRRRGYDVTATDGSAEMAERFRRNAEVAGLRGDDARCELLDWADLTALERRFDYVMCRGNSLVYANTWGTGDDVAAGLGAVEKYLGVFAEVVAPGGWLHIDAPLTLGTADHRHHYRVAEDGRPVALTIGERVTERDDSRYWECEITADYGLGEVGESRFAMHSTLLTVAGLMDMLERLGFDDVRLRHLPGERATHPAVLARRTPGRLSPRR